MKTQEYPTKAGRKATLVTLSEGEQSPVTTEWKNRLYPEKMSHRGYRTAGIAMGVLKRHLETDEAFGWPEGQQFIFEPSRERVGDEEQVLWYVYFA